MALPSALLIALATVAPARISTPPLNVLLLPTNVSVALLPVELVTLSVLPATPVTFENNTVNPEPALPLRASSTVALLVTVTLSN
ncbi:MAG: hypothetical protein PCFJNLEI_04227 [Verrucomicrobiae bacterium]|nr:hypothetical protein [Verrucomicrobiae bacterium]